MYILFYKIICIFNIYVNYNIRFILFICIYIQIYISILGREALIEKKFEKSARLHGAAIDKEQNKVYIYIK